MSQLLFEIGTEELPPALICPLSNQIKKNIIKELIENNIPVKDKEVKTYNTPRRIAVYINNLPLKQETKDVEIKGPDKEKAFDKEGKPTQALVGFAKKHNLEPKELVIKKANNAEYVFAITKTGGQKTKDILAKLLPNSLKQTTGNKFMRWGNYEEKFARPIRWILAILGNEVIDFTYAGIKTNKYSYGHRFFSNEKIEINSPSEYERILEKNFIIPSNLKRKEIIKNKVEQEAKKIGRKAILDETLIEEITNITEYPDTIVCEFHTNFLSLPTPIIQTVLKKHQRYFVVELNTGELSNNFIVVTNGKHSEAEKVIIADGNKKVVRARLNDAKFFYLEDLKRPFTYEERINDLSKITFQKGLGSIKEKVERIVKLSTYISNEENIKLTAQLCKLDLTTHMVFELPELQGQIGGVYANENKFNKNVCDGVSDHYDQSPESITGAIVGLADKIDNICCLFAIGKIPSGSTDPFALRRQGQSIIDTIINNNLNINLTNLLKDYRDKIADSNVKEKLTKTDVEFELISTFLGERLISYLTNKNFKPDIINSVFSVKDPLSNIIETTAKIKTLEEHYENNKEKFNLFLVAAKRLVRIVEKNINGRLDTDNLKSESEILLLKKFEEISKKEYKTHEEFLTHLTTLTNPINTFFEKVLVNDPNPQIKQARQSLLKKGKELFEKICDFNQIQERD